MSTHSSLHTLPPEGGATTGFSGSSIAELSPTRCYWSVMDVPTGMPVRTGVLPPGLLPHLQDDLPVPVEDVHVVCCPSGPDRVVACAVARDDLATIDPTLIELRPSSLPPELGLDPSVDAALLNLLVGEYEPQSRRRQRALRHFVAAGTVLACSLLVCVGLARRANQWTLDARAADRQAATLLAERTLDRSEKSLVASRDAARQVQLLVSQAKPSVDATSSLQALLKVWPASVLSKPQSVNVTSDGISLAVTVEGDPAPFLAAFKAPEGFMLDEPRLNTSGTLTRISLFLRPQAGGLR